jgi:hypothetical protein
MIRPAKESDIPEIVQMLLEFQKEAGCYRHVKPNAKNLELFLRSALESPEVMPIVVYVIGEEIAGTAAIYVSDSWFNTDHKQGQELWWYVKPGFRKKMSVSRRLFEWLDTWPSENGLNSMMIGHTPTLGAERLKDFYEKRGYVVADVFYNKEVK